CFFVEPARRSLVMACTQRFHSVTESGTVNSKLAEPSAPVTRCGYQKAVSANSLRSWTVAAGAAAALRVSSKESMSTYAAAFAAMARRAGGGGAGTGGGADSGTA